ncbi:MAG TPA: secretin and TonB N-terminal domain-containing protein [Bacteroidales bacterium]|nr:secretin and TonB N-terminal domain-containing protein [Bacteroidales bacterium]
MRLSFLLILISTLSLSAGISYSQQTTISLNLENATLREILKEIGRKSDFSFWYKNNELKDDQRMSLSVKDQTIDKIMEFALLNQDLTYEIKDKVILIYKSRSEGLRGLQQQQVKGIVIDATSGEPIAGANVTVEGTTLGSITDGEVK